MSYLSAPAYQFLAVTPSDTVNLQGTTRGLYIGSDGNVVCINESGNAVTFVGLIAGTILPVQTTRVNATNTTSTNIVALF